MHEFIMALDDFSQASKRTTLALLYCMVTNFEISHHHGPFWGPSLINWTTWYSIWTKILKAAEKNTQRILFSIFNDWSFLEFLPNLTFLWSNISIEVLVRYLAQGVCFHFFPTLWKSPLPAALFCVRFSR